MAIFAFIRLIDAFLCVQSLQYGPLLWIAYLDFVFDCPHLQINETCDFVINTNVALASSNKLFIYRLCFLLYYFYLKSILLLSFSQALVI